MMVSMVTLIPISADAASYEYDQNALMNWVGLDSISDASTKGPDDPDTSPSYEPAVFYEGSAKAVSDPFTIPYEQIYIPKYGIKREKRYFVEIFCKNPQNEKAVKYKVTVEQSVDGGDWEVAPFKGPYYTTFPRITNEIRNDNYNWVFLAYYPFHMYKNEVGWRYRYRITVENHLDNRVSNIKDDPTGDPAFGTEERAGFAIYFDSNENTGSEASTYDVGLSKDQNLNWTNLDSRGSGYDVPDWNGMHSEIDHAYFNDIGDYGFINIEFHGPCEYEIWLSCKGIGVDENHRVVLQLFLNGDPYYANYLEENWMSMYFGSFEVFEYEIVTFRFEITYEIPEPSDDLGACIGDMVLEEP